MRPGVSQIGRSQRLNTMVDEHPAESELGFVSHLKNSLSIASRGARANGDLPKTCQLLPSTAILPSQNRYAR